jgi:hypothetical protein
MKLGVETVSWAILACVACSSDPEVPGTGSGGASAATGGAGAASSGGRSASGGQHAAGGSPQATGATGGTSADRDAGSGGTAGTGGRETLPDASAGTTGTEGGIDASTDAPVDGRTTDATSCGASHRTPGGRYRLRIHNLIQEFPSACGGGGGPTTREENGEGLLILEDEFGPFLVADTTPPVFVQASRLHGRFEAPSLTLYTADSPNHTERFEKWPEPGLTPEWFPDDGLPNPYSVSMYTLMSTPPCGGSQQPSCAEPRDEIVITFDTVNWTVKFARRFHLAGNCGYEFVTTQTGTGELDCGDE